MAKTKLGTLVEVLVSFVVLVLLSVMVFGVYCCFFPGTWSRTVDRVAVFWNNTKFRGDRVVSGSWGKVKENGDHLIDSVPRGELKPGPEAPEGDAK